MNDDFPTPTATHPHDFRFPLTISHNPIKRALKGMAGAALCLVRPAHARALDAGEGPAFLSYVDQLMITALWRRAEGRGDLERFIHRQQRRFWSSREIADFHEAQTGYFESNFLGANKVTLDVLEEELARGGFTGLCEIGCGHGRVVQFLSQRLAGLQRFVGIDLSEEQTRRNRVRYGSDRVEWVAGDAQQWLATHAQRGWVYLTHNGVLEYFLRDDLVSMFKAIAQQHAPAIASISEPIAVDYDVDRETASRPYGDERSFSHNYVRILEEAGFRVIHRSEFKSGAHRLLRIVARADGHAQS